MEKISLIICHYKPAEDRFRLTENKEYRNVSTVSSLTLNFLLNLKREYLKK